MALHWLKTSNRNCVRQYWWYLTVKAGSLQAAKFTFPFDSITFLTQFIPTSYDLCLREKIWIIERQGSFSAFMDSLFEQNSRQGKIMCSCFWPQCVRETPHTVCELWPNIWAGAAVVKYLIWVSANICFILRLCLEWQHIDRENRLFALTSPHRLLPIVSYCWPVCCN